MLDYVIQYTKPDNPVNVRTPYGIFRIAHDGIEIKTFEPSDAVAAAYTKDYGADAIKRAITMQRNAMMKAVQFY